MKDKKNVENDKKNVENVLKINCSTYTHEKGNDYNNNLKKINLLNKSTDYAGKKNVEKTLNCIEQENNIFYKFQCKLCNYNTIHRHAYNRHILSKKHKKQVAISEGNIIIENKCVCGNTYKYPSGLSKHKKKCKLHNQDIQENTNTQIVISEFPQLEGVNVNKLLDMFSQLITQNTDITRQNTKLTEQNTDITSQNTKLTEQNTNLTTQMKDQFDKVVELAKEPKIINQTTTNNNQKQFNLMNYLNTECKDAMNFKDMLKTITYSFADIIKLGEDGWVNSVLEKLDELFGDIKQEKRPIHCTDQKRNTYVIKHDNEWIRETADKIFYLIKSTLQHIQKMQSLKWREADAKKIEQDDQLHSLAMKVIIEMCSPDGDNKSAIYKKIFAHLKSYKLNKSLIYS